MLNCLHYVDSGVDDTTGVKHITAMVVKFSCVECGNIFAINKALAQPMALGMK